MNLIIAAVAEAHVFSCIVFFFGFFLLLMTKIIAFCMSDWMSAITGITGSKI